MARGNNITKQDVEKMLSAEAKNNNGKIVKGGLAWKAQKLFNELINIKSKFERGC